MGMIMYAFWGFVSQLLSGVLWFDRLLEYDLRITTRPPGQSIKVAFELNPAGIPEIVNGMEVFLLQTGRLT